ncbi:MAG: hypothetical protein ABSF64_29715 [Bryobacteraceae bacterium]|jgi:hypothetical protein
MAHIGKGRRFRKRLDRRFAEPIRPGLVKAFNERLWQSAVNFGWNLSDGANTSASDRGGETVFGPLGSVRAPFVATAAPVCQVGREF